MKNYFETKPEVKFMQLGDLIKESCETNKPLNISFKKFGNTMCVFVNGALVGPTNQYNIFKMQSTSSIDLCNKLYEYLYTGFGHNFQHTENQNGYPIYYWQFGFATVTFPTEVECQEWVLNRIAEDRARG